MARAADDAAGRYRVLVCVCVAEFLAMSIWFSFSAVKPLLAVEWKLPNSQAGLILSAFQLGYIASVAGIGYLADRLDPRWVIAGFALLAALLNAAFATFAHDLVSAMALRILVGAAMGGVYTPGIKLLSAWFAPGERGRAVGAFVGALVLGSASPYLLAPLATAAGWRTLVYATCGAAVAAALVICGLVPSRQATAGPPPGFSFRVLRDRPLALMNAGYVAHMWELYAMWGWIGPFVAASLVARGVAPQQAATGAGQVAFITIAAGGPACFLAGFVSDRWGRTLTASALLLVSAACSFGFGWLAATPIWLMALVGIVYGFAIVGDSPLYSAGITELAPPKLIGTALGVQSVLGFGTTVVATALFGVVADRFGWAAAFIMLGVGALTGPVALLALRGMPEARLLAGGRR
jgi:MFS family permease